MKVAYQQDDPLNCKIQTGTQFGVVILWCLNTEYLTGYVRSSGTFLIYSHKLLYADYAVHVQYSDVHAHFHSGGIGNEGSTMQVHTSNYLTVE